MQTGDEYEPTMPLMEDASDVEPTKPISENDAGFGNETAEEYVRRMMLSRGMATIEVPEESVADDDIKASSYQMFEKGQAEFQEVLEPDESQRTHSSVEPPQHNLEQHHTRTESNEHLTIED